MMRAIFNLNTSLYLMLVGFTIYFGFEKIGELRARRVTLSAQKDSVHTDVGNFVSPLVGLDMSGKRVEVNFKGQGKPTVVYVFSPICHFCELNEANLEAVFNGAKNTHNFVGVATVTAGLPEYLAQKKITFQVLTHVERGDWKLNLTPEMVVVSADGRLMKNWLGVQDIRKWEVEEYFGFHLPGPRTAEAKYTPQVQ